MKHFKGMVITKLSFIEHCNTIYIINRYIILFICGNPVLAMQWNNKTSLDSVKQACVHGSIQKRYNSIADALELHVMCITQSTCGHVCLKKILCASFQNHRCIQTGVTVRKCSVRVKVGDFFVLCDLDIWRITLKNYRALLLGYMKLCATFHSHL